MPASLAVSIHSITPLNQINWDDEDPDKQKIRITGFFFLNELHWQFEVEKKNLQTAGLGYIHIYAQIKH